MPWGEELGGKGMVEKAEGSRGGRVGSGKGGSTDMYTLELFY